MRPQNIAVIGAGISGLSAAWLLSQKHRVVLYEAAGHLGGHANTVDVETQDGPVSVDTGFMVFNEQNYPNLTALFSHLDVETYLTWMSFSLSIDNGRYEYAGSGANGFFGQRSNAAKPRHWRLLSDIARFFRSASERVIRYRPEIPLGEFLKAEGYSRPFVEDHIVPMGAAIWSTRAEEFMAFPASNFIDFYANHGMLQFARRPRWRTVLGGSSRYVDRLAAATPMEIQSSNPVHRIVRQPDYVLLSDGRGVDRAFDQVVFASHADTTLDILQDADPVERELLGRFRYQMNKTVLHRDPRFMPKRRRLWSSWNYRKAGNGHDAALCVTYWMNRLQDLNTRTNLFVTLNPTDEIHPKAVISEFDYAHPVFTADAMQAQKRLWNLQGNRRTWYCGSYFGFGFHEDGVQSGLAVAEELGQVRRPWDVENESGRIHLRQDLPRVAAGE